MSNEALASNRHSNTGERRMEEELKCPQCSVFYCSPILLPCSHSICEKCASDIQESSQHFLPPIEEGLTPGQHENEILRDFPDVDKISILSETDSGVVCNSRPSSYIGTPSIGNIYHAVQHSQTSYGIRCPVCKRIIYLDENGYKSLPRNKVLESIVEKYCAGKHKPIPLSSRCQMCEHDQSNSDNIKEATVFCEQCDVFYCDSCKEGCHPSRGPLAKHNLVDPIQGKAFQRAKNKGKEAKCSQHVDEHLSMYCLTCRVPVCYTCHQEGGHINHDVQALGAMCKAHKTELSQSLQSLSEKAKAGTEFIQGLKAMIDKVHGNSLEFEALVVAQCDALIEAVRKRKQELVDHVEQEKDLKIRILREQASQCTSLLQRTTGLLHFSIEVLKESDPASFLQVSSGLIGRVAHVDQSFNREMELSPRVSPEFELTLDNKSVLHAIETMNFFQMKGTAALISKFSNLLWKWRSELAHYEYQKGVVAPGKPRIIPEDCSAENNSVTIAWQPHLGNVAESYSLELDDGCGGDFRVVYVGRETVCTVDGLHFNSLYYARVKASNHAGDSEYSDPISLQTAEVAWFNFDILSAHPDLVFSNDNQTVTCNSYDHRVAMGGVGFSKGVHYWEIAIDRYENHSDPAIGIARFDVEKCAMLGKDSKGWSMYIDESRSWFMYNDGHHSRTDGGIQRGSVIGILLDLDKHTLSYFVDEEPHGPIAFTDLHGVFFPAISINRNVQITLRTGLEPPIESESEEE